MRLFKSLFMAMVLIGIIGIGANVYAHREHGSGWGAWGDHGGCMRYQDRTDATGEGSLKEEDFQALEQQRESFLNETKELRTRLSEKGRELQGELAKDTPEATIASQLQKEISDLEAQLDQKRVEHMIEMRKLNPNATHTRMARRHMMGRGPGMRAGKRYGVRSMMGHGFGRGGCNSW